MDGESILADDSAISGDADLDSTSATATGASSTRFRGRPRRFGSGAASAVTSTISVLSDKEFPPLDSQAGLIVDHSHWDSST